MTQKPKADTPLHDTRRQSKDISERPMVSCPMPYRPSPNEPPPVEIKLPKRRRRR